MEGGAGENNDGLCQWTVERDKQRFEEETVIFCGDIYGNDFGDVWSYSASIALGTTRGVDRSISSTAEGLCRKGCGVHHHRDGRPGDGGSNNVVEGARPAVANLDASAFIKFRCSSKEVMSGRIDQCGHPISRRRSS